MLGHQGVLPVRVLLAVATPVETLTPPGIERSSAATSPGAVPASGAPGARAARVHADRGLVAWRRGEPGALDLSREAALRNNLADTLHRAGREDDATEELKRAVATFAEVGGHDDEPRPGVWHLVEW